ncbi:MAG: ATP:cob(I)alamin adenosyltransferase [Bacteroidetes bacterium RIFCSPLOWO2_02_FULL_36_8]|nr:MAG: ATP:cob(I)alamin adenosyltransferase [Bacteroidetes bacterium RIFCSPLOWO2_02_FULL_36_8]OFY72062.1 MAG: ATP:cob(I)alamin adenosyltransferase [Bacteroidetes bacterium RIFCSPLOWO2_12_FULL_37_12]
MKIYTKTGDKGQTSLIGGTRVPKCDIRIEAYGTVDELNSWVGLLKDQEINQEIQETLLFIQNKLFTIGSVLATDTGKSKMKIPELKEEDITLLENEIDEMNYVLPELKNFILPGGHSTISICHIARCTCRRAERHIVQIAEENYVPEIIIKFMNRLSDYLFVLARQLGADLGAKEIPWKGE